MNRNANPLAHNPSFADSTSEMTTNLSRPPFIGRVRLAVMETALCIVIPCMALLIWLHFDSDVRKTLMSGLEHDLPTAINSVYDMAALDETTVITVQGQGQIRMWDLDRRVSTGEIQSHLAELRCVTCSPQGRLVSVGSAVGYLETWDLDHPDQPLASGPRGPHAINTCQFSPNGQFLCSAGESSVIYIWEPRTLKCVGELQSPLAPHGIRSLAFTADGTYLLAGDDNGALHVWDFASRRLLRTLRPANGAGQSSGDLWAHILETVLVLPGDREVVAVTRGQGISVWDIASGCCLRRWHNNAEGLQSATLSRDGMHLITGSICGSISIWDIATGRRLHTLKSYQNLIRALACNSDTTCVLSGDCLGRVRYNDDRE